MEQPLSRRAWLGSLVSGTVAVAAAACGPAQDARELTTPEGRVLQWQGHDLLVLVSGLRERYQPGEVVRVNVLANNQATGPAVVRVRTRILGRADQAIAEAQVAVLNIRSEDAQSVDREIPLGRSIVPMEYTLSVEIPPWQVNGREAGRLVHIRAAFTVEPG